MIDLINVYTVGLLGHRELRDLQYIDMKLEPILKDLVHTKEYVSFLIGRNGEFDKYAASIIKRVQKADGRSNSDITLVLPYKVADIEYYEMYYDGIIIPDSVERAHPKSAITVRNRWLVEQSDLVIVGVERSNGGAYAAMRYAEKLNKKIINLYDNYN